ncbi:hypothetical protein IJT10_00570, partial [bacterium]|nr:hypothetical protein [bacterium]
MTKDKTLTPLFQQYYGLKEAFPDCLVLMQCGDFYEAYGEDAKIFARDLEIVLTAKDGGGGQKIPMAGIPLQSLDYYLRGLVNKGHRVAVAEQTANPAECKGLVPREVTRIVTAGTILDLQVLDEKDHNYLIYIFIVKDKLGLAAADVSTGDLLGSEFESNSEQVVEEILRFRPAEIIFSGDINCEDGHNLRERLQAQLKDVSIVEYAFKLNFSEANELLKREFFLVSLDGLGFANLHSSVIALAGMLDYIKKLSFKHKIPFKLPKLLSYRGNLILDMTTRRNLELVETLLGRERKGSLLEAIDKTCTSMGAR